MGIPSYFSYIIKNHKSIITALFYQPSNLYLDSNSIVYDVAKQLNYEDFFNSMDFETTLILRVCEKINHYIQKVQPTHGVFIAFDGVPPLAKMVQQRERRYKGYLTTQLSKKLNIVEDKPSWNTIHITPGTEFMNKLDKEIKQYFHNYIPLYKEFIISTSVDPGEGEHKLFEYIRKHSNPEHTTFIYGLDADLIILGLNHLKYTRIYLMRETAEFRLDSNYHQELMLLDLNQLKQELDLVMDHKLNDYILLSFFIGNDFFPKLPYINLHQKGMERLTTLYKKVILPTEYIFDGRQIHWSLFKKLILAISQVEHSMFKELYKERNKFHFTSTDVSAKLNALPRIYREVEKYINPFEEGWEHRYYNKLFKVNYTQNNLKKISKNYLEMVEWNIQYYSMDVPNWDIYYHYNYPPLFKDLLSFIPDTNVLLLTPAPILPFTSNQLLAYVLPREYLHLLPKDIYEKIKDKKWYDKCDVEWSYCNFFWESNILCNDIPIKELKKLI
jgi:5'-3' exoribonuclease 1